MSSKIKSKPEARLVVYKQNALKIREKRTKGRNVKMSYRKLIVNKVYIWDGYKNGLLELKKLTIL